MSVSTTPLPTNLGTAPSGHAAPLSSAAARLGRRTGRSGHAGIDVGTDAVAASIAASVVLLMLGATSPLLLPAAVLTWTGSLLATGGYRPQVGSPGLRTRPVLRAAVLVMIAAWVAVAARPDVLGADPTRVVRAGLAACAGAALLSILLGALVLRTRTGSPVPLVLVGPPEGLELALNELERTARSGAPAWVAVAACVPDSDPADLAGGFVFEAERPDLMIWPGVDQVAEAVRAHRAEAVLVVPGAGSDHTLIRRLGVALRDLDADLLVSTGLLDVAESRLAPTMLGGLRAVHLRPASLSGPARVLKDVADRVAAAALLVALAPLLLTLAVLVRRDSPGRALYTQVRIGRRGVPFTVYKFRTMRNGADRVRDELADANESDRAGVLFKIKQDPRITRLGATLRKYSLDELPQLLNVLRGEMSLIGPRPPLPGEVEAYTSDLWHRMAVKPGLTGLWQVSGRSDLSWEETVRLDLSYVDNWSWAQDAAIAVRTVGAVVGHRGAY